MAQINLTARDIDLIGRVVQTEVDHSLAKKDPREYQRQIAAVTDTVMNRLAAERYGFTIQDVIDQPRAFSKIGGPKRLNPYGSVTRAPKASPKTQELVNDHIKGRIAGVKSIVDGSLDYANPKVADKKNIRGWIQPMIDAGAKAFGIGSRTHYHGLAPGNFPAPPTDVYGPAGFASHRGPPGTYEPSSPMRPDEANAAGPKGRFNVLADYSAPLGVVEKGPSLAPASLPPDRQMPTGMIPGSVPDFTAPPDRMMPTGPVQASIPDPFAGALPPDRMMPSGPVRPTLAPELPDLPAQQPTFSPPTDVISPVPGAPASSVVAPTGAFPEAPAGPSTFSKIKDVASPIAKNAMLGLKVGGPIGALAAPALGLLGDKLGIGLDKLGAGFDNAVQDRFSTGFGLKGITSAMGGPKGAQGFSLSNPGMSFTSLGNGMGLRRSDKYGWTVVVDPSGSVVGIKYDDPDKKGIFGKISKSMNGRFGGGLSDKGRAEVDRAGPGLL